MKQENVFENLKLNKSEIVKRRVGEIRLFVVYKVVSQIHRTRLTSVFLNAPWLGLWIKQVNSTEKQVISNNCLAYLLFNPV